MAIPDFAKSNYPIGSRSVSKVSTLLLVAGLILPAFGCSEGGGAGSQKVKTVPFTGKILLDGTPHGDVRVQFIPQGSDGGVRTAYAQVKEDGTFAATTYVTGDGIIPGKYDVTVGAIVDNSSADPAVAMAAVSGASIEKMEVDIPAEGLSDVELKLTSKPKPEGSGNAYGIGL